MNFTFEPVNPVTEKIPAIKLVREFTKAAFGRDLGLKDSKDFICNVIVPAYTLELQKEETRKAVVSLLKFVTTAEGRHNLLSELTRTLPQAIFNRYDSEYSGAFADDIDF